MPNERGARVRTGELLSAGELSRRRARARQIRRRRTAALSAVLVVLIALIVVVVSESGGGASPGPTRTVKLPPPIHGKPPRLGRRARHTAITQQQAVAKVLRYTSYVRLAGHRKREVALTFDDGPGPYTSQVIKVLVRMHATATFFVVGEWARRYPKLVAEEARDGFELGDHTETHAYLSELSEDAQEAEIDEAAMDIRHAGAPTPVLFRPPYGAFDPTTLELLRDRGMLMVLWSADTSDYERPGIARIAYTAISGCQPGAVILMHDGGGNRSETAAALPRIITRLRQRGFKLVTISQLITDDPPPATQPAPRSLSGLG
jgi:peptidoglycan-N-acetylglucosamine deacetylase